MLEQVLSVLGGRMLERWLALALQPLVFGLCCLSAVVWSDGDLHRVRAAAAWLEKAGTPVTVVLVLAALLGLAGCGLAVLALAGPLLRFLQGGGPLWRIGRLGVRRSEAAARAAARTQAEWQQAYLRMTRPGAGPADLTAYQRLERDRRRRPHVAAYATPTRLGNLVRASERRIADRYGLDPAVVWPGLSRLLPEPLVREAGETRAALDRAVAAMVWGAVFAVAMRPFTWWAVPAGLAVVLVAHVGVLPARARRFTGVMEAAFAVHRGELYRALRRPLPATPAEERVTGAALTTYLWRGSGSAGFRFTP
ncbi:MULTISPECIES: hypothetical protein [unclassified Streptomyces]|uniref:hypothetical protein n=1 Tax=unclassified Streptomyces TaxID=2593676 RepID=UPI00225B39E5|nr:MULTISPECIES: hypothetical protein [unclassified Streptomyces]MCX4524092.1 hypothetical protein [Streptomyces sp. NBC_01551]MCX4545390.1 hypothetical protein [Streptomyces sp. NBC_01565]